MIIYGQAKQINRLTELNKRPFHTESDEEFNQSVKDRLATAGLVKTVKYVREEKGLSLIDAKKFVDRLK